MKIFVYLGLLGILAFASCKDEADKQAAEELTIADSTEIEKADTILSGETISFFNQSGFSDFAKSKAPAFDWSKFRMVSSWEDDSLLVSESRKPENYDVYKKLFKYSPDSTKYL